MPSSVNNKTISNVTLISKRRQEKMKQIFSYLSKRISCWLFILFLALTFIEVQPVSLSAGDYQENVDA